MVLKVFRECQGRAGGYCREGGPREDVPRRGHLSHNLEEECFKRKEQQERAWFCHQLDVVVVVDSEKVREGSRR